MGWVPSFEGERPSLGWALLDWIQENLIVPDGPTAGDPLTFTDEQALFVARLYEVDPAFVGPALRKRSMVNGRIIRRAVLSRPKGWGKSPLVAALCLAEALAPVVLDGWDADGKPVGRPWTSLGFRAAVQIIAVSEDQTANTWEPCLEMARNGPVIDNYPIDPMETFIGLPRGKVGFRPIFAAMDQTESWTPSNGGVKLAAAIRRNLSKVNGCSVETPNAFAQGWGSVAESSYAAVKAQDEGRLRISTGMLYDHREAPADTDITDEESLRKGLAYAYGDSADVNGGWVNLDRILADFWDPDTHPQDARGFFLNQIGHTQDAWIAPVEWHARLSEEDPIADGDVVTLGFDGSKKRRHSTTDATALIGCRVRDGKLFEIATWEQPDGPFGDDWEVPMDEVEAAVEGAFERYSVVGFYADPKLWETSVAAWEARWGRRLLVKKSAKHPIEWWFRPTAIIEALEQFHSAVVDGDLCHDGSPVLARHIINARRRPGGHVAKEHATSARKIDAAMAAVLAWQARLDAVAKGVDGVPKRQRKVVVLG